MCLCHRRKGSYRVNKAIKNSNFANIALHSKIHLCFTLLLRPQASPAAAAFVWCFVVSALTKPRLLKRNKCALAVAKKFHSKSLSRTSMKGSYDLVQFYQLQNAQALQVGVFAPPGGKMSLSTGKVLSGIRANSRGGGHQLLTLLLSKKGHSNHEGNI